MNLDEVFLTGYEFAYYSPLNHKDPDDISPDEEYSQDKSFFREAAPDYDFIIKEDVFFPGRGTSNELRAFDMIEDWMKSFSLNSGDLFVSLVNVYNHIDVYKQYVTEMCDGWANAIADMKRKVKAKDESLFSSNDANAILKIFNADQLAQYNTIIANCGQQAVFYQSILHFIGEDDLHDDGYTCKALSSSLEGWAPDKSITPKNIFEGIDSHFNPKLRMVNTTIYFGDEARQYHYYFSDFSDAVIFDLFEFLKKGTIIKKCANCGKYFIPSARSDEIYCDNVFRNGKTCKQLGYELKVNANEVLKAYRTIYKTQNARKQRNKTNIKDIDMRFDLWKKYAKTQLDLCQNGKISLPEMKYYLADDWWIWGKGEELNRG